MSEATVAGTMNVVDAFLKANLLSAIGDDERRYEAVQSTISDLVSTLSSTPAELLRFSRVAFQPSPIAHDPMLESVYDALKGNWKLIDNVFPQERPVTLLRAVMLEVIAQLCEHERTASIVYNANIGAAAHRRYGQGEVIILERILKAAAEKAEVYASRFIEGDENDTEEVPRVHVASIKNVGVDVETLQDALVAAVGPHDQNNKPPNSVKVNSNWPNSGYPWSYAFPPIAAPAIVAAISDAVKSSFDVTSKATANSLNTALQELAKGMRGARHHAPRTLNVLWWMQALYSSAVQRSYRDLNVVSAAALMPHDLLSLDVVPCPESVVHILGEAVRSAVADHDDATRARASVTRWLQRLGESSTPDRLQTTIIRPAGVTDDASLLGAARAVVHGLSVPDLGDLADVEVTPRQLSMWLLRDLVAERLVTSK